jgi:hypothetical protein
MAECVFHQPQRAVLIHAVAETWVRVVFLILRARLFVQMAVLTEPLKRSVIFLVARGDHLANAPAVVRRPRLAFAAADCVVILLLRQIPNVVHTNSETSVVRATTNAAMEHAATLARVNSAAIHLNNAAMQDKLATRS